MAADEPKYLGYVDGLFGDCITGWCCRDGDERPLLLELLVNDQVVATFEANIERGDLAGVGFTSLRHGFRSPAVLRDTPSDAIIRVQVAGAGVEVPRSGLRYADYEQFSSRPPTRPGSKVIPQNAEFIGISSSAFPDTTTVNEFRASSFANFVLEPSGKMRMPPFRVVNRGPDDYRVSAMRTIVPDGRFPAVLAFPRMTITTLENAYCLPFAPPILLEERKVITDFLIPWAQDNAPWFNHAGGNVYRMAVDVDADKIQHEIDTGFYTPLTR
jgi:hypothetical protein